MKNRVLLLFCFALMISCEDVITVDPPAEDPRLSVDALIRIDASKLITTAVVKVGTTSSFFGEFEPTDLDQISIINEDYPSNGLDLNVIPLLKTGPGEYSGSKNTDFFTSGRLTLTLEHEGQRYIAETTYAPSVPFESLQQGNGTLFTGDETEILLTFLDTPDQTDFYLFDFSFDEYLVSEDTFYPGQRFQFSYFYEDGLESGQEIDISILGIEERFYNYMTQLIVQSGGDQGPFQTPAATVRGNIINVTDIDNIDNFDNVGQNDNFALGYFSVSQEYKDSITIQ